jgi:flagellar biosynthetic protein FlhB
MAEQDDAGERTEDPTQKRRDEALKRGDVVKSQEVNAWFVMGGGVLALFAFGGSTATNLYSVLRNLIGNSYAYDLAAIRPLTERIGIEVLLAVAAPFLVLMLAGLAGNVVQHRFVWSTEVLAPKLSRISIMSGAKRLFSKQALVNFAKGLAKLTLIGALMVWLLWPERHHLDAMVLLDPAAILPLAGRLSLKLMAAVAAALAVIAALDYFYQYQVWFNRQKMSLRDVKEEYKQTEGDPIIKGKLRQLRQARMRKRIMSAVPKASVVIMNPTHFAVALQYDDGMSAPICVAKGVDALALKIREVATAHSIPVVENPPLARALHASVEIDEEVPPEHYKAVAEVIGYIMRLRPAVRR